MAKDMFTITIRLCPDEETMQLILRLLNMWQDNNPEKMVALVPAKDGYQYEIIPSGRTVKQNDSD